MRHGRTDYNERALCNDDAGTPVSLNKTGEQQAQLAAEKLRSAKIDRIIVSPLPRTQQTAVIVNQFHQAPIEINAQIADIRTGFNDLPVDDYFAAIAHDPLHARVNGGESLMDHKQRILDFIAWLTQQPEDNILVVAHEETLRVFIAYFEGGVENHQLRDLKIQNCEWRHYKF